LGRDDSGGDLGRALAENTAVSSITLEVSHLLAPSETGIDSAAPLVLFLRNSASLTNVTLKTSRLVRGTSPYDGLEDALLNALAASASIEALLLDGINLSRISNGGTQAGLNRVFGSPCSANHMLSHLILLGEDTEFAQFLPQLSFLRNLRSLGLFVMQSKMTITARFDALAHFFSSTLTLSQLWLGGFKFRGDSAKEVLSAISQSPIATLSLIRCEFDSGTTDSFIKLVQCTGKQSPRTRSICDLTLDRVTFDNRTVGQILAVCLIGLPLKELRWIHREGDSDLGIVALFDSLATTPTKISLSCLALPVLNSRDIDSMARFLPLSTSLRALYIDPLVDSVNHFQLLSAVRRNGSLYCAKVGTHGLDGGEFVAQRNFWIPKMMKNPLLYDTEDTESKVHLRLFPTFFKVAQGAPRTAPNSMFIGLMAAAGDVIGSLARSASRNGKVPRK
jgi:hypothetical protein